MTSKCAMHPFDMRIDFDESLDLSSGDRLYAIANSASDDEELEKWFENLDRKYEMEESESFFDTNTKLTIGVVYPKHYNKLTEPIRAEDVFTIDNLYISYRRVSAGKRDRSHSIKFKRNLFVKLHELRESLLNGTFRVGKLSCFTIYEPKKREIASDTFADKIVQDVLAKHVFQFTIMPGVIYDNYGSQPNKGTKVAVERCIKHCRAFVKDHHYTGIGWCYSFDIRKFFYTIDQEITMKMVNALMIDDILKNIVSQFIHCCMKEINPYTDEDGFGLCIGFQTSQWMSVLYLNGLDHYIKEQLHIKYYGRYVDDFYLIHEDRAYLEECYEKIKTYLKNELHMELNEKTHIAPFSQGVCFLGYRMYYNTDTHQIEAKVRGKSIRRMQKRNRNLVKMLKEDQITLDTAIASLDSWYAYAAHGTVKNHRVENAYEKAKRDLENAAILIKPDETASKDVLIDHRKLAYLDENHDTHGFYVLRKRKDLQNRPELDNLFNYNNTQKDYNRRESAHIYRDNQNAYADYIWDCTIKNRTPNLIPRTATYMGKAGVKRRDARELLFETNLKTLQEGIYGGRNFNNIQCGRTCRKKKHHHKGYRNKKRMSMQVWPV